jgi:Endonuclease/Exonuclease/phosphatase family
VRHKSAAIQQWIRDTKPTVAALVETWHDDVHSPDLIAWIPPGFTLIERARPRNDDMSLLTNHGGVCLLCDVSLHPREIPLPVFSSFEIVCAYIHRSGLSAVLVVVYRTGNVIQDFYDQFCDLLERLATFSASLIVVGDFNIHVDNPMDADANRFAEIVSCNGLQQHVTSPTHRLGHTLDLFITRPKLSVHMFPVDPSLLSDHSFLVVDVACPQQPVADTPPGSSLTRNWRSFDVEAFTADLMCSDLVVNLTHLTMLQRFRLLRCNVAVATGQACASSTQTRAGLARQLV